MTKKKDRLFIFTMSFLWLLAMSLFSLPLGGYNITKTLSIFGIGLIICIVITFSY